MKNKLLHKFSFFLMKSSPITICIIDDVDTYFNPSMLELARKTFPIDFERWNEVDEIKLLDLTENPRDIVIIDIKGTVRKEVGKDGFDVANHLMDCTSSYVVTTSAHRFHMKNRTEYGDYILTDRLLTPIDFVKEIQLIIEDYLNRKLKVYKKIIFRIGFKAISKSI